MSNPMCWYLDKKTMKPWKSSIKEFHELVIKSLKTNTDKEEVVTTKKVKGFFDFLKRK
jgi:hypothetical protein